MNRYGVVVMDSKNVKCEHLNGFYNELSSLIGIEAVLKIHSQYRGQQINLPIELFSKQFIFNQIVSDYDGHNVNSLATKYGYSVKWIRHILKEHIDKSK